MPKVSASFHECGELRTWTIPLAADGETCPPPPPPVLPHFWTKFLHAALSILLLFFNQCCGINNNLRPHKKIELVIVLLVAQIRGQGIFFNFNLFYDHKTSCRILHIFLTRSMQTSSSIVVETIPWPSIMIVATMNGISTPNFTMNATKFHITMPRKLASTTLYSVALCAMQVL